MGWLEELNLVVCQMHMWSSLSKVSLEMIELCSCLYKAFTCILICVNNFKESHKTQWNDHIINVTHSGDTVCMCAYIQPVTVLDMWACVLK